MPRDHDPPIVVAARNGSTDLVSKALKWGDNVNSKGRSGMTALHHAMAQNNEPLFRFLIGQGADPALEDAQGRNCEEMAQQLDIGRFVHTPPQDKRKSGALLSGTPDGSELGDDERKNRLKKSIARLKLKRAMVKVQAVSALSAAVGGVQYNGQDPRTTSSPKSSSLPTADSSGTTGISKHPHPPKELKKQGSTKSMRRQKSKESLVSSSKSAKSAASDDKPVNNASAKVTSPADAFSENKSILVNDTQNGHGKSAPIDSANEIDRVVSPQERILRADVPSHVGLRGKKGLGEDWRTVRVKEKSEREFQSWKHADKRFGWKEGEDEDSEELDSETETDSSSRPSSKPGSARNSPHWTSVKNMVSPSSQRSRQGSASSLKDLFSGISPSDKDQGMQQIAPGGDHKGGSTSSDDEDDEPSSRWTKLPVAGDSKLAGKSGPVANKSIHDVAIKAHAVSKSVKKLKSVVRRNFDWTGPMLKDLTMSFLQMVDTVRDTETRLVEAGKRAQKERMHSEKLQSELQNLRGNVRVLCRVRPMTKNDILDEIAISGFPSGGIETVKAAQLAVTVPEDDVLAVADVDVGMRKTYAFDRVYKDSEGQNIVFNDVKPLVLDAMDGFNVCVMAYGQTGAGKTHTMEGPEDDAGIYFRTVNAMFETAEERSWHVKYEIRLSIVEVYNECVYDLLVDPDVAANRKGKTSKAGNDGLQVRVLASGIHLGATEISIDDPAQMSDLIALAGSNRSMGSTAANEHSSRSHLILTFRIKGVGLGDGKTTNGVLHMVDLAGSERLAHVGPGASANTLAEGKYINRSLSALHDVVTALSNKEAHVPFRHSKLTQIMQDSLGGNAKIVVIVALSPGLQDVRETLSSLSFARRVKSIQLGGVKRDVENRQWAKREIEHQKSLTQKDKRIKDLEQQVSKLLRDAKARAGKSSRIGASSSNDRVASSASNRNSSVMSDHKMLAASSIVKGIAEERKAWQAEKQKLLAQRQMLMKTVDQLTSKLQAAQEKGFLSTLVSPAPNSSRMSTARVATADIEAAASPDGGSDLMLEPDQRVQLWKRRCMELKLDLSKEQIESKKLRTELRMANNQLRSSNSRTDELTKRLTQHQLLPEAEWKDSLRSDSALQALATHRDGRSSSRAPSTALLATYKE